MSAPADGGPGGRPPGDSGEDHDVVYLCGRVAAVWERLLSYTTARAGRSRAGGTKSGLSAIGSALAQVMEGPRYTAPRSVPDESAVRAAVEARGDAAEESGKRLRLRTLEQRYGLSAGQTQALVLILAPEIDDRFALCFDRLSGGRSGHASVGVIADLLPGVSLRELLSPQALLRDSGLIDIVAGREPAAQHTARVPRRVLLHLLGDDAPAPLLEPYTALTDPPGPRLPYDRELAAALGTATGTAPFVYVRQAAGADCLPAIGGGLGGTVHLDLRRTRPDTDLTAVLHGALTECWLRSRTLVIGPLGEPADEEERRAVVRALTGGARGRGVPAVVFGAADWHAAAGEPVPVVLPCAAPGHAQRRAAWAAALGPDLCATELDAIRIPLSRIPSAVRAAAAQAQARAEPLQARHVHNSVRLCTAPELERLARRITPSARWEDLVLPARQREQLRNLAVRARNRDLVMGDWRIRERAGVGRGVAGLFSGAPGTGKTLAAEVLAGVLGVDLFVVDLAMVVDKYVGETEKNLARVFDQAAGLNAVLLFDEADALFGTRTEAKDHHDRHANLKVAYLLQRMESFDGLAILTTNLPNAVDQAFLRRLDAVVAFPDPGPEERALIWRVCLRGKIPLAPGIDTEVLGRHLDLPGGEIRRCVVTACYRAAAEQRAVTMSDLVDAAAEEYRKLGRLARDTAFAPCRAAADAVDTAAPAAPDGLGGGVPSTPAETADAVLGTVRTG
ncbi:ATP-binding protein [Streptomyces yaizuensis]|uniref:AAA family ATPase n=1 Tax=Streptomyces yaizuensis TaxID=2989713 RepID=A0ABQ5NY35_9ACTN|nr:ATP-binding protein [Streptomyces sp. YSPA8]GLF95284.1 AAA family ATPase [Streptomyces sp. YSPA8]